MTRYPLILATVLIPAVGASAASFDFEDVAVGTVYGDSAGDVAGDVVLTLDDTDMSVETFTLGAFSNLGDATVVEPPTSFFPAAVNPTHALQINNVNVQFDFTGVPFDVTRVSFDYVDLGGDENFDLNGAGRQELGLLSSIAPVAGFSINVTSIPIGGGVHGTVDVVAEPGNRIETLLVGGQEFAIDNVNKIPEPSTLLGGLACAGLCALRRRRSACVAPWEA